MTRACAIMGLGICSSFIHAYVCSGRSGWTTPVGPFYAFSETSIVVAATVLVAP